MVEPLSCMVPRWHRNRRGGLIPHDQRWDWMATANRGHADPDRDLWLHGVHNPFPGRARKRADR